MKWFQILCLCIGLCAFVVFQWACNSFQSHSRSNNPAVAVITPQRTISTPPKTRISFIQFAKQVRVAHLCHCCLLPFPAITYTSLTELHWLEQLFTRRNFVVFLFLSFLQQFDCTYEKTFIGRAMASAGGDTVTLQTRSSLISLAFAVPHLVTVCMVPLLKKV